MWPPGGGTNPINPRFLSLFATFYIEAPEEENKKLIYESILKAHMKN